MSVYGKETAKSLDSTYDWFYDETRLELWARSAKAKSTAMINYRVDVFEDFREITSTIFLELHRLSGIWWVISVCDVSIRYVLKNFEFRGKLELEAFCERKWCECPTRFPEQPPLTAAICAELGSNAAAHQLEALQNA